jgi:GTP 3',8-cyclase
MDNPGKAGPFLLKDNFGRIINYLRLAVTDRCNLRCFYCMPEEGIKYVSHSEILTYEESSRLISIFSDLGVNKLRITGGEPFVRKGLIDFMHSVLKSLPLISFYITTNGILTYQFLDMLKEIGIKGINLSLDTLNKDKFKSIAKKDLLNEVLKTLERIIEIQIPLKINTVVLKGFNTDEIKDIASLVKNENIEVRFIEQMPFNGKNNSINFSTAEEILTILHKIFPEIMPLNNNSTADLFSIPGYKGRIGIIGSYSRTFCNTCNRIRITPDGRLKTCLYDNGVLDLREMLRGNYSDTEIKNAIIGCVNKKFKNGFDTENTLKFSIKNSMAKIGG